MSNKQRLLSPFVFHTRLLIAAVAATICVALCSVAAASNVTPATCPEESRGQRSGEWHGVIRTDDGDIPFKFSFLKKDGSDSDVALDLTGYGYFDIRPTVTSQDDQLVFDFSVYRSSVRISLQGENSILEGTWTAGGKSFDVTVYRHGDYRPCFSREDVVFNNGEVKLAGTLLLPEGPGPFPAVVWTHGSGSVTRDNPVYRGPAFWLAENGIASLIYDKRGAGKSTGSHARDPYDDLADDAIEGVRVLAKRKEIDPKRIGVGGISQGGWLTPYAASRSDDVRFCVALSAPGISPPDQNVFNQHNALLRAGFSEEQAAMASKILSAAYHHARTGEDREEALRGLELAKSQPWYKAAWEIAYFEKEPLPQGPISNPFLDFVPEKVWRNVKVPVIAIWGELDSAVPAQVSKRVVREALDEINNHHRTLLVLPGTGHDLRLEVNSVWAPWHPGNRAMIDFIHGLNDVRPSLPPGMEK